MMSELTFRQLQTEQIAWVHHNFPGRDTYYPLLGALEELGELSHHHLKRIQGIRGTAAEHHEKAKDAIADVVIFLSDYCTANGYDLQEIIETTWAEVKQRDWRKDPERGGSESVPCWDQIAEKDRNMAEIVTSIDTERALQIVGSIGGKACAAKLTPERRREIAKTGAAKRWGKK